MRRRNTQRIGYVGIVSIANRYHMIALDPILAKIIAKDPLAHEFNAAVFELLQLCKPVIERNPEILAYNVVERLFEAEMQVSFRVPWLDSNSEIRINRGYVVGFSSTLGPYCGGFRVHPSLTLELVKWLALTTTFRHAIIGIPLGGGFLGADFDPKGKGDAEVMHFCQSFMSEAYRYIVSNSFHFRGDIGIGGREIGFLSGQYKKIGNTSTIPMIGKRLSCGGILLRPEAAGYGLVYFANEMLAMNGDDLTGKKCLVSGSGALAQSTAEKIIQAGGIVLTLSDSDGYIFDKDGIDTEKLIYIKELKNVRRGRIEEYIHRFKHSVYSNLDHKRDWNPLWAHEAYAAFPCATQNEITKHDAANLISNGVTCIIEGSSHPLTNDAIKFVLKKGLLYAPSIASNIGGTIVNYLEILQNHLRLSLDRQEIDDALRSTITSVFRSVKKTSEEYSLGTDFFTATRVLGLERIAKAMLSDGVV